jgi:hypothetical protein
MRILLMFIISQFICASVYCQKFKIESTESYFMIKTLKLSPMTTNGLIGPVKGDGQIIYDSKNKTIIFFDRNGKTIKYFIQKTISSTNSDNCLEILFEVVSTTENIADKGLVKLFLYNQQYKLNNVDVLIFENENLISIIRGNKAELIEVE